MILIFFSFFAKKRQHGSQDQLKLITKMNCIKKLKVFDWISPKLWLWKLEDVHFERLSFFYDFWNWESLTACAVLAFEPKSGCYWPPTVWFLHSAMGHFLRILEEREEQLQKNIHKYCFFALYLDQYNLHTYAPIKKKLRDCILGTRQATILAVVFLWQIKILTLFWVAVCPSPRLR